MRLRSPLRLIDGLGAITTFIERRSSRAAMIALDRLFGARSALLYFLHSPFVRMTSARLAFVLDIVERRVGHDEARALVRDLLMQPSARRYRFVARAGHLAPSAPELDAEAEALVAAARDRPALLELLAEFATTRGATRLAFKALCGLPDGREGRSAKLRVGLAALVPTPIDLLLGGGPDQRPVADWVNDAIRSGRIAGAPCRHRLLVMGSKLDPVEIQQLAQGADALTLLIHRDLYGQIDTDELAAMLPGVDVTVEHGRTRVDRFTERYHEIHSLTASLSRELIGEVWDLITQVIDLPVEREALLPWLTQEVADLVFFSALRANALHTVIGDDRFDDVVVSFGSDWRMYRSVAAVASGSVRSRLRVCCWSSDPTDRRKFPQRLRAAAELSERQFVRSSPPALHAHTRANLVARVRSYVARVGNARRLTGTRRDENPSVVFVTTQERAYLRESTQVALELQQRFNLDVLWMEGLPSRFEQEVALLDETGSQAGSMPGHLNGWRVAPAKAELDAFHALFRDHSRGFVRRLVDGQAVLTDPAVRVAFTSELEASIVPVVLKALGRVSFAAVAMKRYDYKCAIVSPIRNPRNTQVVAIARMLGVPTLAVEPHCLVASYCRHGAVPTDYAALFGPYFVNEYGRHFGIPEERCVPIGSPRVQRPPDYDFERTRASARREIGLAPHDPPVVLFPTQPMPRGIALEVWRRIARAAATLEFPVRVLLKPHPEDGRERVSQYREIIDAEGATGICEVSNDEFRPLMLSSDLLLACYSVTALEAAVLDKHVAIVGLPGVEYPIDYDEILAVPRCNSTEQIAAVMSDLRAAPRRADLRRFRQENPAAFDADYMPRLTDLVEQLGAQGDAATRPRDSLPDWPFVTAPFKPYMVAPADPIVEGAV